MKSKVINFSAGTHPPEVGAANHYTTVDNFIVLKNEKPFLSHFRKLRELSENKKRKIWIT